MSIDSGFPHRDTEPDVAVPWVRRLLWTVGAAMVAWGLIGLLTSARSNPVAWLRFAATVVIANDVVLAPLVILAGVLLKRLLPARHRALAQIGLLVTGAVTLVALPAVLGYGRSADNPSALPLNYGRGLLLVTGGVWAIIGWIAVLRRLRSAGRPRPK
jgi:hypothetical protein